MAHGNCVYQGHAWKYYITLFIASLHDGNILCVWYSNVRSYFYQCRINSNGSCAKTSFAFRMDTPWFPWLNLFRQQRISVTYWGRISSNIWIRISLQVKQQPSILHWYLRYHLKYAKVLLLDNIPNGNCFTYHDMQIYCCEFVAMFIGALQFIEWVSEWVGE